jgi:hypothetical protein
MHRQLARLSSRHATTQSAPSARIAKAVAQSTGHDRRADVATVTAAFTDDVRRYLGLLTNKGTQTGSRPSKNGLLLRYSQRLELLRMGEQTGLSRFQANLVIAAIQHEARGSHSASATQPSNGVSATAMFLITQAVLIITLLAIFLFAGQ